MDDKVFLLNKLNLVNAILGNDAEGVKTVITALNAVTLTTDQITSIKETLISLFDGDTSNLDINLIKSVINQINEINKNYLLNLLELKMLSLRDSSSKTIIQQKLQDTSIVFDNDNDKYNYYYTLSNYAIVLKDRTLIQAAITVVQAL
ncbi:hypothetical protein [Clostridium kluyveri]|uniref:Uncharacterized protein n=2 Tax=Clostridium kluyveri TaxID=1534 RepID=A5N990_CLOK5|nr:hypothetical protein [Clostridium kluyveri]EDK33871.1 Hypothetical protein CKL_1829 [Clostridium kluyveri DSM 555]BAH06751.1 hypothetical protein CKR_1700 [Clostridium kluyveri NBRC 12016]